MPFPPAAPPINSPTWITDLPAFDPNTALGTEAGPIVEAGALSQITLNQLYALIANYFIATPLDGTLTDPPGAFQLVAGSGVTGDWIGGIALIQSGAGGANSDGGDITIQAGAGGSTAGNGGNFFARAGSAPGGGNGGGFQYQAGDGKGMGNSGGAIFFQSGNATSGATPGKINFVTSGTLNIIGLPTSSVGLSSGDLWRDAGAANVIKMVP